MSDQQSTRKETLSHEEKMAIVRASRPVLNRYMFDRSVVIIGHDGAKPLDHGSGVLLRLPEAMVVLTAAHVISDFSCDSLQILAGRDATNKKFAPVNKAHKGGRQTGRVDVGYLEIADAQIGLLGDKKHLTLSHLDVFPTKLNQDLVMSFGYPVTARENDSAAAFVFESFSFWSSIPTEPKWKPQRPEQVAVDYPLNFVNAFSDREEDLPDPHGMSGGGFWRCPYGAHEIWTPDSCRLVAINVEFLADRRVVRANTLEALMRLLGRKFASAQQHLERQLEELRARS